ncbi:MAG: nuclear transport factor 2 family protein [Betaproteobacteria bacterium]|nr:nuclear transport factor 2 family protein [Betaproteobacteria bacterium]
MSATEARNVEVVRRYYDGCNAGDLDGLLGTLAPDVVHYFLPSGFPPVRGAEHLARYWKKNKDLFNSLWTIDHVMAQGDEVVVEWSLFWTPKGAQRRLVTRGSEWYVLRAGRIAEVRAYFMHDDAGNTELADFPYRQRGYPTIAA